MPVTRLGAVSVILVNFRGADDTIVAIEELGRLDWPADCLEIVVVENASGDDSAARIREAAPHVRLIESSTNGGFTAGCNLGVAESSGEFVAFLNNDAKPDARWLSAAVAHFEESSRVGAVASRVLDWDGERVDYVGAGLTWYGMGYKPHTGDPLPKSEPGVHDVLFGTGSAMIVRRDVYEALGGFDERYFMFFEDVDFGWRLNLAGWRYVYEPASYVYHKHHASMAGYGDHKEQFLLERNALFTLYKNIGEESLGAALPAAMALAIRRGLTRTRDVDNGAYDLRVGGGDDTADEPFPKSAIAVNLAIDQFVDQMPSLRASREEIQATRRVSDARLWARFGLVDAPVLHHPRYVEGYENIVNTFDVTEPPPARRVVIVTGDPIGIRMAGPAIRAWNIAELLAREHTVTLVSLTGVEDLATEFDLVHVAAGDDRAFRVLERAADVIIFQGHAMEAFPSLRDTDKIVVVDVYDPMHLEQLEQGRELPKEVWGRQVADATETLNAQLARGDFFVCASERQRTFWLGQLAGLGRINPATYVGDPMLEGLIGVAPFGISSTDPGHRRDVVKGVVPGIGRDDKLLLWSGGLYNWFDPETLIRAVAALTERRAGVRLFFQGTKHPHPGVPEMEIVARSRALAAELGVLGVAVFFNDSWVEYAERENYLTEADAGVSTHYSHIETTFSFRTRILDYLWARLPMVVTQGDHFAELVQAEGLGIAVPDRDVTALADALERILFDDQFAQACRDNISRVREDYRWERTLAPILDFVRDPLPAADRGRVQDRPRRRRKETGLRHDASLVLHHLRTSGVRVVAGKVVRRLRRR